MAGLAVGSELITKQDDHCADNNCCSVIENDNGETGLDLARRLKHTLCEELVSQRAFQQ